MIPGSLRPDTTEITAPTSGSTYWRDQWQQQRLALLDSRKGEGSSFWNDKKAVRCHFIRDLNEWRDFAETRIAGMGIKDGSRVLDIGAGTGTLSVPLAFHGCDVTAVEPSAVMGDALLEYQKDQKTKEITLIRKRWEDVTAGELGEPFDAVISSYSLMVTDIGDAVAKMQQCCRGTVHIFWFLTQPLWAQVNAGVWKQLHDTEFCGEPTSDTLWQVLYEMGIYANLAVEPGCEPAFYPTIEDAVKEFHGRMNCTTPEQYEILRAYFSRTLVKSEKGYYVNGRALGAHLWWDANEQQSRMNKNGRL
ncbi:MAG TPA: class I SAM-dependent methyltransferase [Methanoregula sp.]|nr:class I SAM-dependent methyltransferase [Methanoregula sp.]